MPERKDFQISGSDVFEIRGQELLIADPLYLGFREQFWLQLLDYANFQQERELVLPNGLFYCHTASRISVYQHRDQIRFVDQEDSKLPTLSVANDHSILVVGEVNTYLEDARHLFFSRAGIMPSKLKEYQETMQRIREGQMAQVLKVKPGLYGYRKVDNGLVISRQTS